MALSFTERLRYGAGGRYFLYLDVDMDETTSTFSAASVGMTYLDFVGELGFKVAASGAANQSVMLGYLRASVIAEGTQVEMGVPLKAGSTKHFLLIGW